MENGEGKDVRKERQENERRESHAAQTSIPTATPDLSIFSLAVTTMAANERLQIF